MARETFEQLMFYFGFKGRPPRRRPPREQLALPLERPRQAPPPVVLERPVPGPVLERQVPARAGKRPAKPAAKAKPAKPAAKAKQIEAFTKADAKRAARFLGDHRFTPSVLAAAMTKELERARRAGPVDLPRYGALGYSIGSVVRFAKWALARLDPRGTRTMERALAASRAKPAKPAKPARAAKPAKPARAAKPAALPAPKPSPVAPPVAIIHLSLDDLGGKIYDTSARGAKAWGIVQKILHKPAALKFAGGVKGGPEGPQPWFSAVFVDPELSDEARTAFAQRAVDALRGLGYQVTFKNWIADDKAIFDRIVREHAEAPAKALPKPAPIAKPPRVAKPRKERAPRAPRVNVEAVAEAVEHAESDPLAVPAPIAPPGYKPAECTTEGPAWGAEYNDALADASERAAIEAGDDEDRFRVLLRAYFSEHPRFPAWQALEQHCVTGFRAKHARKRRTTETSTTETKRALADVAAELGEDIRGSAEHLDRLTLGGQASYWRRLHRKTRSVDALRRARELETRLRAAKRKGGGVATHRAA